MRDANKVQIHVNRWRNWCLQNPEIVRQRGIDNIIRALRQRIASGGDEVRISLWEHQHRRQYVLRSFANARTDIEELIREVRDTFADRGREVYASGQRERANGVAEYLNQNGHEAKAQFLTDGRSRNRRYVVIER